MSETNNNFWPAFLAGGIIGIIAGGLICFALNDVDGDPVTIPCDPPDKIISLEKAQELYDTYTDRREGIISTHETEDQGLLSAFVPSRCGEYDYDTLRQYIQFLDCIDAQLKVNNDSIKSIRFYFGTYPNARQFKNGEDVTVSPNGSYEGRNTFMVVPTSVINGKDQGFLYNIESGVIEIDSLNSGRPDFKSIILNEAGLKPPPPQGDDFSN